MHGLQTYNCLRACIKHLRWVWRTQMKREKLRAKTRELYIDDTCINLSVWIMQLPLISEIQKETEKEVCKQLVLVYFRCILNPSFLHKVFHPPRQIFTSQPPWLPHSLGTKMIAAAATANIHFSVIWGKRAASSLSGQTGTDCTNWDKHQADGWWAVWGVVPASDRMSAENKCNGPVGAPASPAQACTCRRWCKALRGPLLAAEFTGFPEDTGFRSGLAWNSLPSHVPAMTMQKRSWEANTAGPQQLLAITLSPWCSAKLRGWESGRPELSSGGAPGRSCKALLGQGPQITWFSSSSSSSNVYGVNKVMNESVNWLTN